MIGLDNLEDYLTGLNTDEATAWLEGGLRTIGVSRFASGVELAFAPVIFVRSEPPLEQFHSAFEMLSGPNQARLRLACGRLVASLRDHDSADYLQVLLAVAASLRPPIGMFSACRKLLSMERAGRFNPEEAKNISDRMITGVLGYSQTSELTNLIQEIKGSGLWHQRNTEQYASFLARNAGRDWPFALCTIDSDLKKIVGTRRFFWQRIAREIGQFNLLAGLMEIEGDARMEWIVSAFAQFAEVRVRGTQFEVVIVDDAKSIPFDSLPEASDARLETMLKFVAPASSHEDAMSRFSNFVMRPRAV